MSDEFYGDAVEKFTAMANNGGNPGEAHFRMWCRIAAKEIAGLREQVAEMERKRETPAARGGIWGKTDSWVEAILDYSAAKVREDIGQRQYQYETSIGAMEDVQGKEPGEEYYRGFDDGLRAAILTIELIKSGDM